MIKRTREYWSDWVRLRAYSSHPLELNAKTIYIIPSALGWAFLVVILSLFICAINYQVSAIFFMTFLLASAGMASAWEAHDNLNGLTVHCVSIDDGYCGGMVRVTLALRMPKKIAYSIEYYFEKESSLHLERLPLEGRQITLYLPAPKRGVFKLPRVTISSVYPLGLFCVWGYAYFDDAVYYVYPQNIATGFWPNSTLKNAGSHSSCVLGHEDFYELKEVNEPWTQSSRIAWKIAARGQGWYLKSMVSEEGRSWMFRIEDLPRAEVEESLQALCYWLNTAELEGYFYGLELKGKRTALSQGASHLTECLRQLASY